MTNVLTSKALYRIIDNFKQNNNICRRVTAKNI